MLKLTTLQSQPRKHSRRIGRGNGSGRGTFSGRGMKGQRARSGSRGGLKLRGLRSLFKAIPKTRGFNGKERTLEMINLNVIDKRYADQAKVTLHGYKVLGTGEITRPIEVTADGFSASAKAKLEKAGGKAITCGKHS